MTTEPETVTVELRRNLACESVGILDAEVAAADEYHSTEQYMEELADVLRAAIESPPNDT